MFMTRQFRVDQSDQQPMLITSGDQRCILARATRAAAAGSEDAARLLRHISSAIVVEDGGFPDDVTRLNSFVTYASPGQQPQKRALIFPECGVWPPVELSVFTSLGQALLGRRVGAIIRAGDGGVIDGAVEIQGVGPVLQFGLMLWPRASSKPSMPALEHV
jgi:transcription elongation GreA/GreB family factor